MTLVTITASAQVSVERFTEIRQARLTPPDIGIESAAVSFIQSCQSSTPLTGGAGASPAGAIIEFRDLVASHPVTVIRLRRGIKIDDKSGVRGEPQLEIIDISIIKTGHNQFRVFAYTDGIGNLVEFRRPSKDTETRLNALLKKIQVQKDDAGQPPTSPESK
ncbi:MAG: hypothetical protein MUF31_16070 [Akkermansiaceae bacterium]|nr:hypothetical protein [Akkermansiaceae bacterium]